MFSYWILTGRRLLLWGLLPIVAGICAGWSGWRWRADSAAFVENLRTVDGRITRFTPQPGELLLDVEYWDEAGIRYSRSFPVERRMESNLRTVGKISIIYDRRNPHRVEVGNIVTAHYETLLAGSVLCLGALLFLGGLGFLGYRGRQLAAISGLFRRGQVVQTEVRDNTLAPGKRVGCFTYAFRGPNGRWFEGRSPELPENLLRQWPAGQPLYAAYDAADPRRNEADIFGLIAGKRKNAPLPA